MKNPSNPHEFVKELHSIKPTYKMLCITKHGCPACVGLKQEIPKLERKYNGKISFINLDVDNFMDLVRQNNIDAVPTSIMVQTSGDNIVWSSKKLIGYDDNEFEKVISSKIN